MDKYTCIAECDTLSKRQEHYRIIHITSFIIIILGITFFLC